MSEIRIASRYSKSLAHLATEANSLDSVYQDITDIRLALSESRDLASVLKSPIVKAEQKKGILTQVLKGQNALTIKFALYLVDKKREMYFAEICDAFIDHYHQLKGIAKAKVTSAFTLDAATIESVKKYLSSTFSKDEILIENVVDKSVIGGMVIQYEDRLLDMSVRKEIQEIKKQLIYN
jgi:F-type H+-transporting ATPase subunit delta